MKTQSFTLDLNGKKIIAEFNDLTAQANGSVILKSGETVILVTAVMNKRENNSSGFFPLSVEFEEKFYSTGMMLGSRYQRREAKPSDEAVLSARIIDRTIRPLFNQNIRHDVQVVVTVLALGEDDPDVLGVIGASLALAVSDIPWRGPIGCVRIGRHKDSGALIINPTYLERLTDNLDLEVLACGKDGTINMIETMSHEVSEADITNILETSTKFHRQIEAWQKAIVAEIGKAKRPEPELETPELLIEIFNSQFKANLFQTIFSKTSGKNHIYELKDLFVKTCQDADLDSALAESFFINKIDVELHQGVIEEGIRPDGRNLDEVRPLFAQAGNLSPALHGSGIFYRGETHVFSALTLAGPDSSQIIETIEAKEFKKSFIHHYNFPPYSVGETGRVGGFNRRMIGHGALAEKALVPVIPDQTKFPYTIRLVSETLSSNGSSSMGSVCASTLALMDGGVPITRPVAGIASGVMINKDKYQLITDIQGPEDEFGDMDFKVAGTTLGITAIQMDVKVDGIPIKILAEALEKARLARLQILEVMVKEISTPREKISARAPEIICLNILPSQIGLVIGSGGKTINGIKDDTGVEEITIEDDGRVYIVGKNGTAPKAATIIRSLTKIYTLGERAEATITKLTTFGAFAKLDDYNEGLIHISEIAPFRLETVEGVLSVGEVVPVIVSKMEEGKIGLSIKQADPQFAERKGLSPEK